MISLLVLHILTILRWKFNLQIVSSQDKKKTIFSISLCRLKLLADQGVDWFVTGWLITHHWFENKNVCLHSLVPGTRYAKSGKSYSKFSQIPKVPMTLTNLVKGFHSKRNESVKRYLVVTLNENHLVIHLFNSIKILNKFKIFKYHRIGK